MTQTKHHYRWYWTLRPIRGRWGLRFDTWLVRTTGVSAYLAQVALARRLPWNPALVLTTIGRGSGEPRSVVLPYVRHGKSFLVYGSNAGGPKHPHWVLNLMAEPMVWITDNRERRAAKARIAQGAERAELMLVMRHVRPHVDEYAGRAAEAGREIALVILEPASPTPTLTADAVH